MGGGEGIEQPLLKELRGREGEFPSLQAGGERRVGPHPRQDDRDDPEVQNRQRQEGGRRENGRGPSDRGRGLNAPGESTMSAATVLVVDDDLANLESVSRIFQREGLDALTATNGKDALELLRRPDITLMVTDLMMPGLDGQGRLKPAPAMPPDVEGAFMTAYGT